LELDFSPFFVGPIKKISKIIEMWIYLQLCLKHNSVISEG